MAAVREILGPRSAVWWSGVIGKPLATILIQNWFKLANYLKCSQKNKNESKNKNKNLELNSN